MNLYNFLKQCFFNKKTEKFIKTYFLKNNLPCSNLELIKRKLEELNKLEESPEKIITSYLLTLILKKERVDYEKDKEELRKVLNNKGFCFDPVMYHKLFRAISYFLFKNYSYY